MVATAATLTAPAVGAQATAPTTVAPASRIAELMTPREKFLEGTGHSFDQQFARSMGNDPHSAMFEKTHPGVTAVAVAAARKVLMDAVIAGLPRLRADFMRVISDNMDGVEQAGLLNFLRSPAGLKLVGMGDQIYSADKMADSATASGKLTQQEMADAVDPSFINKLAPAEIAGITAFTAMPAGQKLRAITPKLQTVTATWVNDVMSTQRAALQQAVGNAIRTYVMAEKATGPRSPDHPSPRTSPH